MRKGVKFSVTSNMFGHTTTAKINGQVVTLTENQESNWMEHNARLVDGYWFRAPSITQEGLISTLAALGQLDGTYGLEVWADGDRLDGSLRVATEDDAATVAWCLTNTWMKWGRAAESELKASRREAKPLTATVDEHGVVRVKGRVRVTQIGS